MCMYMYIHTYTDDDDYNNMTENSSDSIYQK